VRLIFKTQLVEIIVFTEARVVKTTEAGASVASNVATAMIVHLLHRLHGVDVPEFSKCQYVVVNVQQCSLLHGYAIPA